MKPKALIRALAGAAIGAAVWYALVTREILQETGWIPILIGTLTGIGAWLFAEPMVHAWQRGAVVSAIALTAAYFTQQGTSYALEHGFEFTSISFNEAYFSYLPAEEPSPLRRSEPADWHPLRRFDPSGVCESVVNTAPDSAPIVADAPLPEPIEQQPPLSPDQATDAKTVSNAEPDVGPSVSDRTIAEVDADALPQPLPPPVQARAARHPTESAQSLLVALSYAVGTLLAYFLGRGPELRARKDEPAPCT